MIPKIDAISSLIPEIEAPQLLTSIGTNKQSVIEKIIQFSKGQSFQAEVLAKLSNGQFQIKIADTKFNIKLPNNPQIGEKLNFTILTLTPRIIFSFEGVGRITIDDANASQQLLTKFEELINKTESKIAKSSSTNQVEFKENQSTTSQLKNTLQSSSLDLSDTAKIINQLLQETAVSTSGNKANIRNISPLLLTPTSTEQTKSASTILNNISNTSEILNLQLRNQITSSGLFYEAHVSAWLQGKFQQHKLLLEPQANIPLALRDSILSKTDNVHHETIVQLIHQQLDISENNRINWQGMLFPNAPMEWTVIEEKESSPKSNIEKENITNWNSTIRLTLPNLGELEVKLQLQNQFLSLNIAAKKIDAVDILIESQSILNQSIQNTGTTIQAFSITHNDEVKNE
jgi:hypothetical protein